MNTYKSFLLVALILLCGATQSMASVLNFDAWTSDNHTDGSTSTKTYDFIALEGTTLSFKWSVSSEYNYDKLIVTLDGVLLFEESGEANGIFEREIALGEHTLLFSYVKDGSTTDGNDQATVYDIKVECTDIDIDEEDFAEFVSTLEDYPAFKEEIQLVYDEYLQLDDSATEDDRRKATFRYYEVKNRIKSAIEAIESIVNRIAEIDTLSDLNSYSELKEALNVAKTISTASTTTEVLEAQKFLNQEWAVYCAFHTNMDEWNFNASSSINGFSVYVDSQNKVSSVYLADSFPCIDHTMTIPRLFEINKEFYPVVHIEGGTNNSSSRDKVEHIVLPSTLQYIGNNAFCNFDNLKQLDIPASVKKVASSFVSSSDRLRIIDFNAHAPILDEQFSMPNSYVYLRVPDIYLDDYLDHQYWGLARVIAKNARTIEVTLTEQGDLGWHILIQEEDVRKVNRLVVKSGILNAEDWTYLKSMRNLIYVDLSGCSNTELPSYVFDQSKIDSIVLPNTLTSIGSYAFRGCSIRNIVIPENVTSVGSYSFQYCHDLVSVSLSNSVNEIHDYAFSNSGIRSIVIPKSVTYIGQKCFYNCRSLEMVQLLGTINTLDSYCFQDCTRLKTVQLLGTINDLGYSCFQNCSSLRTIDLNEGLNRISNRCFCNCDSLESIVLPSTVKAIEEQAFYSCWNLTEITLNEGLQSIAGSAFTYCGLESITLPSSLQKCTGAPFNSCDNLKSITVHSVIAPDAEATCPVSGIDLDQVTLYVPKISKIEYQLAGGWSSILNVVPIDYMPEDIVVSRDFTFRMEMDSTAYNPNFSLVWTTNGTRGNLKVHTAGKLNANKFSMYYSPYAKYYYDQTQFQSWGSSTQYNTTTLIVNGEMRAESTEIIMMNRNNQWQFVSFPFDVKMSDIVAQNDSTQWVIREYSGANRAEGLMDETWQNLDSTAVLKAGKGYIMHCFSTHEPVLFSVRPDITSVTRQNIFMSEDIAMPLEKHESEFAHNMSWNLIGNPYPAFFDFNFTDFNAPITVWNSCNQNYVAMVPGDDNFILSPGESFFVQCPVDKDSITFSAEGRQKDLTLRDEVVQSRNAKAAQRSLLNLSIEGEGTADRTRVVINEEAKMDYEMHCDASKFGAMDEKSVLLYTIQGNMHMAINERPLASGRVMMGVSIGETGDYTLTAQVPEGMTVTLEDRATGKRVLLDGGQAYDFHATKGDYNNRFTLHISAAGETAIEKVETEQQDEAPAYNVAGQRINAKDAKGVVIQDAKKVIK